MIDEYKERKEQLHIAYSNSLDEGLKEQCRYDGKKGLTRLDEVLKELAIKFDLPVGTQLELLEVK